VPLRNKPKKTRRRGLGSLVYALMNGPPWAARPTPF